MWHQYVIPRTLHDFGEVKGDFTLLDHALIWKIMRE